MSASCIEPIAADCSYEKSDFLRRVGLKAHAWRTAVRQGLRVVRCHGRAYVLGRDWIDYLAAQADQPA